MIYAIGDIHGMYDKLMSLMNKIHIDFEKDYFIFLGDYIDRGEKSIECLKYVKKLTEKYSHVIALMGNHEDMMINFYKGLDDTWTYNGYETTKKQLNELKQSEFEEILKWAENLPLWYKIGKYIFVHAGINPFYGLDKQVKEDLLWIRESFFANYEGEDIIVVGHTSTQCLEEDYNKPLILKNNIYMLDTGSYRYKGKITCMNIETRKYVQDDIEEIYDE